jgi:hypothetical protein
MLGERHRDNDEGKFATGAEQQARAQGIPPIHPEGADQRRDDQQFQQYHATR